MAEQEDEEKTERTEFGYLCNYNVEHIFSLVPLRPRKRRKVVSESHPPTTDTGLVLHFKRMAKFSGDVSQESVFLKLQPCTLHSSGPNEFHYLIDSRNGLLLYGSVKDGVWNYDISSPILDQSIALPPAHFISRPAFVNLAFDPGRKNEFKVHCFFFEEVNHGSNKINSLVFSSESWEWKEKQGRLLNSGLILQMGFVPGHCFRSAVYSNGRFYLIWSLCLLIFDEDGELFTLLPLPSRCHDHLWESDGKLHSCNPEGNGFLIWDFVGEEGKFDCGSLWKPSQFVDIDNLVSERKNITAGKSITACAFNEDLQVLFMHVLPNAIVAYSFQTKTFLQVWSWGDLTERGFYISKIHTFLFKPVNLIDFKKPAYD